MNPDTLLKQAMKIDKAVPSLNVPYIEMMEPIVQAVNDMDSIAMIAVARIEWMKFESKGMREIRDEFLRTTDGVHTLLHLDHVPVIDEDGKAVNYEDVIAEAMDLGYQSVMVDGSRLPLKENIEAVRKVTKAAHARGIPVEAELGKVLGHETDQSLSYEEILRTRTGFTDAEETRQFVEESACDWLSVAFGNIHGAVSELLRDKKKPAGQLDIPYLEKLAEAAGIPLVLHGGSGVTTEVLQQAIRGGIAKVNVGTDVRQAYEAALKESGLKKAQDAVYECVCGLIENHFRNKGLLAELNSMTGS